MRIAVLLHSGDRHRDVSCYNIEQLASYWREDGHEVIYLFGTGRYVPADIIIVHVNLSVVPEKYLQFAARYPKVLNGKVRDIRKSTISRNLVRSGDDWPGPVIVKSDLNYSGEPERKLLRSWVERRWRMARRARRALDRLTGNTVPFDESHPYEVYDCLADVPPDVFKNRHAVIEKFRPEIEDGLHFVRVYQFLGDQSSCVRIGASTKVVKSEGSVRAEQIEPEAEVVEWRRQLSMDYGKLDYVVSDGEVVLLDANKTTGSTSRFGEEQWVALRRKRASGIYSYFEGDLRREGGS